MSARARRPPTDEVKTKIYDSAERAGKSAEPAAPSPVAPSVERSAPMHAISMKTPGGAGKPANARPEVPKVQLRSIAEIAGPRDQKSLHGLGNLAPPRDPKEVRGRRIWSNTFWASIAVIIASLVTLGIWLIAGRR